MKREYYILWYQLDKNDGYLIWFSTDDKDGIWINENNLILSFQNIEDLQRFTSEIGISIKKEDPLLHNLDIVKQWLSEDSAEIKDYNPFLDAWNLFDDVSYSTNSNFNSDRKVTKKIYEKIFWGCNLPAVTPEGKSYEPIWSKKELKIIKETLSDGFQIFEKNIKPFQN